MNDQSNRAAHTVPNASAQHPQRRPATTKRRKPKTTEEQLADAMAKADALKAKALKQRDGLRMGLVEDLFLRFDVGEIDGDVCERKRLATLREKLDV